MWRLRNWPPTPKQSCSVEEDSISVGAQAKFMDAVVKVYCVHCQPNFSLPWQRNRQYATTSTGFMVEGGGKERWLLTNAHSVEYKSQVRPVTNTPRNSRRDQH